MKKLGFLEVNTATNETGVSGAWEISATGFARRRLFFWYGWMNNHHSARLNRCIRNFRQGVVFFFLISIMISNDLQARPIWLWILYETIDFQKWNLLREHATVAGGIATSRCQNLKSKGSRAVFRCESSRLRAAKFFFFFTMFWKECKHMPYLRFGCQGVRTVTRLNMSAKKHDIVFVRLLLAIFLPQIVPQISDLELVWLSHIPHPCNFHRMRVLS